MLCLFAAVVGGVMLESTDWQGGLRDRALAVSAQQKAAVEPAIERVIRVVRTTVFPIHADKMRE